MFVSLLDELLSPASDVYISDLYLAGLKTFPELQKSDVALPICNFYCAFSLLAELHRRFCGLLAICGYFPLFAYIQALVFWMYIRIWGKEILSCFCKTAVKSAFVMETMFYTPQYTRKSFASPSPSQTPRSERGRASRSETRESRVVEDLSNRFDKEKGVNVQVILRCRYS